MNIALSLAHRGLGRTWPNPSVGCVIIKGEEIIGRSRTANGGRPHAEILALEKSKIKNQKSKIYVTLEPCAHHGKTPPCAEALVAAGVGEVVIGCVDPDPRVAGKGVEILRAGGVNVVVGVLEKECRSLNAGFFKRVEKGLPYVTLKTAVSADGKYLVGTGAPRFVTGELARNYVHLMRMQNDAVVTGTGTVLADNPRLDCRLPGCEEFSPVKVVIGSSKIPKSANIFKGKECWVYSSDDLELVLRSLAEKGVTRVMVEAGPKLADAFLREGLVDEVVVMQSAQKLGVGGLEFFGKNALAGFGKIDEQEIGSDLKLLFQRKLQSLS